MAEADFAGLGGEACSPNSRGSVLEGLGFRGSRFRGVSGLGVQEVQRFGGLGFRGKGGSGV